ncbi:hypothetical protein QPK87_18135 [Kamptonema cortianum]|nr:hypothetical protein [Geitlerinema splendidum]MDK3158476.1 hypothetical protein [Kamptonema cortianum]
MSGEKRVYSEKEATDLVIQAVRLQESSEHGGEYTPGISYDELRRMAADVGVDERYLQAAIKGVPIVREERKFFLGIPVASEFERVIDGELPPENFDVITEALWKNSWSPRGRHGLQQLVPTQVGRTMQGQISSGAAWGQIRVSSKNGRTRVWARNNAFIPFMAGLYPSLIISFILTLATFASDGDKIPAAVGIPLILGLLTIGFIAFHLDV